MLYSREFLFSSSGELSDEFNSCVAMSSMVTSGMMVNPLSQLVVSGLKRESLLE